VTLTFKILHTVISLLQIGDIVLYNASVDADKMIIVLCVPAIWGNNLRNL